MPEQVKKMWIIRGKEADKRLDKTLIDFHAPHFPDLSMATRSFISELIHSGRIMVNKKLVKPSYRLKVGDELEIIDNLSPHLPLTQEPIPIPALEPVFEDEHLVIIDKPAGLLVHSAGKEPQATLVDWFRARYPKEAALFGDDTRPGIVHRLDRDTSGVMLLAKTPEAAEALRDLFRAREVKKRYMAVVAGHMPSENGEIDAAIVRRKGSEKRDVVDLSLPSARAARPALTKYRVVKRYREVDLVEVEPKTGRTHQIRVHLRSLGHPVIGDALYAFRGAPVLPMPVARQLLHAIAIRFTLHGQKYEFEVPLPLDFRSVLERID